MQLKVEQKINEKQQQRELTLIIFMPIQNQHFILHESVLTKIIYRLQQQYISSNACE